MGAREKLNLVYAEGCLVLAGVVGLMAGSWAAFLVALAMLVAGAWSAGNIRPRRRR